jgi:hypothetical protein
MPTVYRFRVSFEDHDDVYRDIEIRSNQTFEDLHCIIQSAINFDALKPASFIMSNDYWIKGQEISLHPKQDREGKTLPAMAEAKLSEYIVDPHQKIIYVYDYDANWNLQIELIKLLPAADEKRNYPVCVKSNGEAPKQYTIINVPKATPAIEDELSALLMGDGILNATEEDEAEEDDPLALKEDMMEEAEVGVEMDEIEGMNEEGEEEEASEEDGEEQMGLQDTDEDSRDDQY